MRTTLHPSARDAGNTVHFMDTCRIEGCTNKRKGLGTLCSKHSARWYRKKSFADPPSIQEKFDARVDKSGGPDSCWLWTGYIASNGYPRFASKYWAHRYAYEMAHGEIPKGMFVCHVCDEPRCVNPKHLWLGTHQDNMDDAKRKGRMFRRHNETTYQIIRTLLAQGGISQKEIARQLGVSESLVSSVKHGKTRC